MDMEKNGIKEKIVLLIVIFIISLGVGFYAIPYLVERATDKELTQTEEAEISVAGAGTVDGTIETIEVEDVDEITEDAETEDTSGEEIIMISELPRQKTEDKETPQDPKFEEDDSWNDRTHNELKYKLYDSKVDAPLKNITVSLTSAADATSGDKYIVDHRWVSNAIRVEIYMKDYDESILKDSVVTCSWGSIINGEGEPEQEVDMSIAENGQTYLEKYCKDAQGTGNARECGWMIYLPDDPEIEGFQNITIKAGGAERTFWIKLDYLGSYHGFTGWQLAGIEK